MAAYTKDVSGSLSFSGKVSRYPTVIVIHNATLAFGAFIIGINRLLRSVNKTLTGASISFSGRFITQLNAGAKKFYVTLLATCRLVSALTIKTKPVYTAALSFVGKNIHGNLFAKFTAALSFVGTHIRTRAKIFKPTLSFVGSLSEKMRRGIVLASNLRFRPALIQKWHDVYVDMFASVRMLAQFVQARVISQYKITGLIDSSRAVQTIGTTATLINLTDLSSTPFLYVQNLDLVNYVEIDSSSSFVNFPQKIPAGNAVFLSPETTTIYARAHGSPVRIRLMPSIRPAQQFTKKIVSSLRLIGSRVVPETFPMLFPATLSFHGGGLPPLGRSVFKADAPSSDAYIEKDLGSTYSEIWVTMDVAFDAAALAWWSNPSNQYGGDFVELYPSGHGFFVATYWPEPGWHAGNWAVSTQPNQGDFPDPVTTGWHTHEFHYAASGNTELYIDGGSPMTILSGTATTVEFVRVGLSFAMTGDAADIAYFTNVKVGTTRGASDIFQDDFSGGDFSNWTSTVGTCTIINDPF